VWLGTPLAAAVLHRTLLYWKSKCALSVQVYRFLLAPRANRTQPHWNGWVYRFSAAVLRGCAAFCSKNNLTSA